MNESYFYEKIQERWSLAQRDYPKGIGVGKTLLIKRMVLNRREQANSPLWVIVPRIQDEIIKRCIKKWKEYEKNKENTKTKDTS